MIAGLPPLRDAANEVAVARGAEDRAVGSRVLVDDLRPDRGMHRHGHTVRLQPGGDLPGALRNVVRLPARHPGEVRDGVLSKAPAA